MDRLLQMNNNSTFQALVSLKKTNAVAAANALGEFMQQIVDQYGDVAPECAPVYYEYGSACLLAAEESSDVFGSAVVEKTKEEAKARLLEEQLQGGSQLPPTIPENKEKKEPTDTTSTDEPKKEIPAIASKPESGVSTDTDTKVQEGNISKEQGEKEDASTNILDALIEEYKNQNNGQDPTNEILLQWQETLKSANLSELGLTSAEDNSTPAEVKNEASGNPGSEKGVPSTESTAQQSEAKVVDEGVEKQKAVEEEPVAPTTDQPSAESATKEEENVKSPGSDPSTQEVAAVPAPEEPAVLDGEDVSEFLEIAWECLEAARVIAEKLVGTAGDQNSENELLQFISKCLLRLGDHGMETGAFDGCVTDFLKCLKIREQICKPHARELADVHYSLGNGYMYSSSEEKELKAAKGKRVEALKHYTEAARILNAFRLSMVGVFSLSSQAAGSTDQSSKGKAKIPSIDVLQETAVKESNLIAERILEDLKSTPQGVTTLSESDLQTYNDLRETLKLMVEKINEVVETLVNPEASDAVSKAKAKEIVSAAMAAQLGTSSSPFGVPTLGEGAQVSTLTAKSTSAFGAPTLEGTSQQVNTLTATSARAPKNLTQTRKSADPIGTAPTSTTESKKRKSFEGSEVSGDQNKKAKEGTGNLASSSGITS